MFLLQDYSNEVFLRAENIFERQFLSGFVQARVAVLGYRDAHLSGSGSTWGVLSAHVSPDCTQTYQFPDFTFIFRNIQDLIYCLRETHPVLVTD